MVSFFRHFEVHLIGVSMRTLLAGALATSLSLICVGTASAGGSPAARPAPRMELPASAAASDAVRAGTRFSAMFGGVALSNQGTRVTVYLTELNPKLEHAIEGSDSPELFTFVSTPHSLAQLIALRDRIGLDLPRLRAEGITLAQWGPDITTGREQITTLGDSSTARERLARRYGAATIEVAAATELPRAVDRMSDNSPWNGGDFITDDVTGDCTSGFGAHSATKTYMLTAAHCFSAGSTIFNGSVTQSVGGTGLMGTVASRDLTNNGLDAESIDTNGVLDGGSSKLVWTGGSTNPQIASVSGTTNSPLYDQVCQSGAFEGEICSLEIVSASECINESDGSNVRPVCNVFEADNTAGGIANGEGDSGGPVFRFSGSYLYAIGLDTAGGGTQTQCPTWQTTPGRLCFSKMYYTDINPVLTEFGFTINR